ncbi:MAG: hypothetical protein ACOCZ5_01870 [bacterium]
MKFNSQNYPKILQQIKQQDIRLNAFLIEGTPYQFENGILKIKFPDDKKFHMQQVKKNKDRLIKILNSIVDDNVIDIEVKEDVDVIAKVCELFNGKVIKTNVEVLK